MKIFSKLTLFVIVSSLLVMGCDKTEPYDTTVAPSIVHFAGAATQTYSILVPTAPVYNVAIGTNDVSAVDRTVTYEISSPTGAVAGNQYTVTGGGSVVIPAGTPLGSIPIQGNYDSYTTGRIDTLLIALREPSVAVSDFLDTLKLVLRGPCFEGDVSLPALSGVFDNTNEDFGGSTYGPYTTTVTNAMLTTPTTATIQITNIWDSGWGPLTFNMDWTDPENRTLQVVPQTSGIANAGTISSTYAGQQVAVRPYPGMTGTFSACDNTLTVVMQLGVAGLGYFAQVYTVYLVR